MSVSFLPKVIVPAIHAVLPMSQAAEAHGILEQGKQIGKVVLSVV